MLGLGVDLRVAHRLDVLLPLNMAIVSGEVLELRALGERTVLVTQVVLEVDKVPGNMTHGSASHDA